jgi:hypothetical protein
VRPESFASETVSEQVASWVLPLLVSSNAVFCACLGCFVFGGAPCVSLPCPPATWCAGPMRAGSCASGVVLCECPNRAPNAWCAGPEMGAAGGKGVLPQASWVAWWRPRRPLWCSFHVPSVSPNVVRGATKEVAGGLDCVPWRSANAWCAGPCVCEVSAMCRPADVSRTIRLTFNSAKRCRVDLRPIPSIDALQLDVLTEPVVLSNLVLWNPSHAI